MHCMCMCMGMCTCTCTCMGMGMGMGMGMCVARGAVRGRGRTPCPNTRGAVPPRGNEHGPSTPRSSIGRQVVVYCDRGDDRAPAVVLAALLAQPRVPRGPRAAGLASLPRGPRPVAAATSSSIEQHRAATNCNQPQPAATSCGHNEHGGLHGTVTGTRSALYSAQARFSSYLTAGTLRPARRLEAAATAKGPAVVCLPAAVRLRARRDGCSCSRGGHGCRRPWRHTCYGGDAHSAGQG